MSGVTTVPVFLQTGSVRVASPSAVNAACGDRAFNFAFLAGHIRIVGLPSNPGIVPLLIIQNNPRPMRLFTRAPLTITSHASALHRVCSITRRTRSIRSQVGQRGASVSFFVFGLRGSVLSLTPGICHSTISETVDFYVGEDRDARSHVDALEPFIPLAAHEVTPDLLGDEHNGLCGKRTSRDVLNRRRNVDVPAVDKVAKGVQHAFVDRHAHWTERSFAVFRSPPFLRETLDRGDRESGIRKRQQVRISDAEMGGATKVAAHVAHERMESIEDLL